MTHPRAFRWFVSKPDSQDTEDGYFYILKIKISYLFYKFLTFFSCLLSGCEVFWSIIGKENYLQFILFCLDNMLDLTEIATVERIFRLFDRIDKAKYYEAKKDLLKYGKDISFCPGAKLDVLFDTWSDFSER